MRASCACSSALVDHESVLRALSRMPLSLPGSPGARAATASGRVALPGCVRAIGGARWRPRFEVKNRPVCCLGPPSLRDVRSVERRFGSAPLHKQARTFALMSRKVFCRRGRNLPSLVVRRTPDSRAEFVRPDRDAFEFALIRRVVEMDRPPI